MSVGKERDPEAYRDGQVDQRLDNFDKHFEIINGSVAETAKQLISLTTAITNLSRDVADLSRTVAIYSPQVEKLVSEGVGTKLVAAAVIDGRNQQETFWERQREKIAWGLGIAVTSILLARNLIGF